MARTHGRIKVEVWEAGSDFRALSLGAQWAYEMLVSQPGISMCGVLLYAPKRWAKLARDLTLETVEQAIAELEEAWYVIVDRETDELLIRTFIKHDEPWKMPNLVKAARRQWREIDSESIRDYLVQRHAWILDADMGAEAVKEWEETRASERTSERTLPLTFERALGSRAPARNARAPQPSPGPTPTPGPTPVRSSSVGSTPSPARESEANGLPVHQELLIGKLVAVIGAHADEGTVGVVRSYAARLSEGSLVKVLESVSLAQPKNRAAYVVAGLKDELEGGEKPFEGEEPS